MSSEGIRYHEGTRYQRAQAARQVLTADGILCAAAASVLAAVPAALPVLGLRRRGRWPLVAALGATAGLCMSGASRRRPPAALMTAAAVVNLGWVVACTSTLHRGTGIGKAAMVVTATFDATAATLQWILRPDDERLLFEHLPEDLLAKAVTS